MKFSLRQLEYAEALARHRNYREAAAELHISQPALTRGIKALESNLGGQLFDRLVTGVEPTWVGQVFLERARQLLAESRDLEREVGASLGLRGGALAVATGPYPGEYLVPEALARLVCKHPELNCRLYESDWSEIPEGLLSRLVDIAIADINTVERDRRFTTELLIDDPLYYVCRPGHPLAIRTEVPLEAIQAYPLVSNRVPEQMMGFLANPGASGAVSPATGEFEPRIQVTTFSATKRVLFSSDAVSLAPILQIEPELSNGTLTLIQTEPVPLRMKSGLLYLAGRTLKPAALQFMEEVREVKSQMDERSGVVEARFRQR